MRRNITQKLIESHLLEGEMKAGEEIGIKMDQTLTQDATGTLVMLELEALELDQVQTELSVQYVDHNLLQTDYKNPDDHEFLRSACQRFGIWYSRAGNGVSHPVHMERFGIPGKTLVGSDSHTPAAGGLGMLAIGSGGLDIAMVMAGKPYYLKMPEVLGVKLTGKLPDWCSAKDVVLTMLEHYDVKGCVNKVIEYYGPGLEELSAMDRHVIANMGTEMGATSTVFPSDEVTKKFLRSQDREDDWVEISADEGAEYDENFELELSEIRPKIALPSSPGNVRNVSDVAGKEIGQVVVGSSANPGLRDFWIVGEMVENRTVSPNVSLDINPTSRQVIENLGKMGTMNKLIHAGARFHQSGCLGCIGMGQAPASGQISLRTMPRNFPGRSGTADDQVYLCSPETAAASAIHGKITDPRDMDINYPQYEDPEKEIINTLMLEEPPEDGTNVELKKGPNVQSLPNLEPLKEEYELSVDMKLKDNVSTDEILPGGARVLPYRSNIPKISEFAFYQVDEDYYDRAQKSKEEFDGHLLVAGENYAQGSSREHAALAVKYLGQVAVLAKSYARIGWQNLVNFGVIPLEFTDDGDYEKIDQGEKVKLKNVVEALKNGDPIMVETGSGDEIKATYSLSDRQIDMLLAGGKINKVKEDL